VLPHFLHRRNFSAQPFCDNRQRFQAHIFTRIKNTDIVSAEKMANHYGDEKAVDNTQDENHVQHREHMTVGRYLATRLPTLKPPMNKAPNPFKLILLLNKRQWAFFFVGFIAWVWL
jgi:hypothetical protein